MASEFSQPAELTDFFLVAHSFGGYLSGNYALKYNQHIRKLILLSPIGVRVKPEEEIGQDPMERFKGGQGPPKWVQSMAKWAWAKKVSPFQVSRALGKCATLKALQGFVERRQNVDKDEQIAVIRDYMFHIYQRSGTTEAALMVNFDLTLHAHLPLGTEDKLADPNFPIPVSFFYGSRDWVRMIDKDFAQNCVAANQEKFPDSSKFIEIPDSDHNMHMDNPQALCNGIINELLGENLPIVGLDEQEEDENMITHAFFDYEGEIQGGMVQEEQPQDSYVEE